MPLKDILVYVDESRRAAGTVAAACTLALSHDAHLTGLAVNRPAGIGLDRVATSDRPTGCATIWVDSGGENSIVVASGANLDARAVQVSDSAPGPDTLVALQMEVPVEENWAFIERAKAAGARVLLNLAPAGMVPGAILRSVDYLAANEIQAAALDNGYRLYDALCRASAGAGLACRIKGAQSGLPRREEIEASLPDLPGGRRLA